MRPARSNGMRSLGHIGTVGTIESMPKGEYLQYGGQAIVEGVMMRSPRFCSVACRAPNGRIVLDTEELEKSWIGRQKWLKIPFVRGATAILDAMHLGHKALRFSSQVQLRPDLQAASEPQAASEGRSEVLHSDKSAESIHSIQIGAAMLIGLVVGLLLFNYLPNVIAEQTASLGVTNQYLKNLVSEIVKISLFLGYLSLIRLYPEMRRLFMYHGAEHKAINTLEADQPLTIDNCLAQTRLHPRCGTSFAIIVLVLSLLLFTFVPRYPLGESEYRLLNAFVRFLVEVALLPFVAGIAYELLRFAGKMRNNTGVMAVFMPGLMTQYITTVEPDETQVEVALVALQAVMAAEETGALPRPDEVAEAEPAMV